MKLLILIAALFLAGCTPKEATVHQRLPDGSIVDCAISERDPSIFNSILTTSCLSSNPKVQVFVGTGTSMVSAGETVGMIVSPVTPVLAKAPTPTAEATP